METPETPDTLRDAIIWFSDFEHCRQFMMELRWPDGVVKCPHCGSDHVTYLAKSRRWKCYAKHSMPTFTLKTGTIFEDSPIPLEKWLAAAWMIVSCKNGVSSYEIHRGLGVTQKTAWFMLQRLRLAMQDQNAAKLVGEVEVDETYVGGDARNMHRDRRERVMAGKHGGAPHKTAVQAMLQRGGEIRTKVLSRPHHGWDLVKNVKDRVERGSTIYSDQLLAYFSLRADYAHEFINHSEAYVRGNVHTNGLENFWSLLKRALGGTYVSVEPYHLFRYVDEQAFKFNRRKATDSERFCGIMKQIVGRRVTYKELTGKME